MAITLMACYGAPTCDGDECGSCSDSDSDRDGYGTVGYICGPDTDCDDSNADIHPGASDPIDGIDQNCDGEDGIAGMSSSSSGGGAGGSAGAGGMGGSAGGMGGAGGN